MLVQKGAVTKRTKILLAVLGGLVIIGGGYFAYQSYFSQSEPAPKSLIKSDIGMDLQQRVGEFDDEIFSDPQLFSLQRKKFIGFTDQYKGITLSGNDPLPPENISVSNPKMGQKLVISWRLPDYINFNKIRVYRSEKLGEAGEIIYEETVNEDNQQKVMDYQDRELVNNLTYYYLVRSVISGDQDGKEIESDIRRSISQLQEKGIPTDEQPPAPPDNVQVRGLDDETIEILWLNPVDSDFYRIKIYRSSEKGRLGSLVDGSKYDFIGHKKSDGDFRYFIDSDIKPNITYYYTVTSIDTSGNESSADILAAPYKPYFYNPFEPVEF
jgi:hypothetical protein